MNTDLLHDPEAVDLGMLRDAARAYCRDAGAHGSAVDDARFWRDIAGLGWLGTCVPEALDGSGLGLRAAGTLAAETGRIGRTRAVADTLALTAAWQRAAGGAATAQARALLASVLAGDAQLAFSPGLLPQAQEQQETTVPRVPGTRLLLLVRDGARATGLLELDTGREGAAVRTSARAGEWAPPAGTDGLAAGRPLLPLAEDGQALLDDALRIRACLAAAQLVGSVQATLAMCLDYAGVRSQFGHLIGSYQAVQHALVDMLATSDAAELLLHNALRALDRRGADAASLAAGAVAFARETAWTGLMKAYDVLGGVGFVEEHPINRLTRSMLPILAELGSAAACEAQAADHVTRGHWLPASTPRG